MKSPTIILNEARERTKHSTSPTTSIRSSVLILLLLACIGVSSKVQAVSPPPDGGYPGGNTAEGQAALFSLTTGTGNTATGFKTLFRNTTGFSNTANGNNALFSNTTGEGNTAIDKVRSVLTRPASPMLPSELVHSLPRQTARAIRPSVLTRSRPPPPPSKTRPLATKRLPSAM